MTPRDDAFNDAIDGIRNAIVYFASKAERFVSGGQSVSKVELCDRGQTFAAFDLTNQDTIPQMSDSGRRCFRRAVIPPDQRAHRAKLVPRYVAAQIPRPLAQLVEG